VTSGGPGSHGAPGSNGGYQGQPSSDLWSIPLGAVELDDAALWSNGDILDRLSAVLPEVAPPESASSGAAHGGRAETRRARRAAEAAVGEPGTRRRGGVLRRAAGGDGLSKPVLGAILALSFSGAVLVGMVFAPSPFVPSRPIPSGSSTPAGPASNARIVTNGPRECPMYAAPPEGPNVPPDPQAGGCFFAG
jgi:hypothetical protein